VLVIKDAHYPWLLLVPRRPEAVEIIDLDEVEQAQLMTEISRVARALKEITKCDKLNIARSAIWCRNCTCTSSPAAPAMPPGRVRSGA
jgi:diadenosine tetraphosphate (Ap4A) HIT family hydrolase